MDRGKRAYWQRRARQHPGPPLPPPARPGNEDIAGFEACAQARFVALQRPLRVLLLGFTRGVLAMRWPADTSIVALDWSDAMLRRIWPGLRLPAGADPVIADWREMPHPRAAFDLVIGDGCFAAQSSYADCAAVSDEVWRVLQPAGWFVQRCFSRPPSPEPLDALFADLRAGRIPVFEEFRWRLAMALHPAGIPVLAADIWRAWQEHCPDPHALCAALGWPADAMVAMNGWKDQQVQIPLPTLGELHELTAARFDWLDCRLPRHSLGRCFPTLVLAARP